MTPHLNLLDKMVLMRGHNIRFRCIFKIFSSNTLFRPLMFSFTCLYVIIFFLAAEYCKKLKSERSQMQNEADILKQEINSLNQSIRYCILHRVAVISINFRTEVLEQTVDTD